MAIPTPRSLNSILGSMVDTFLSRFGIRSLRIGGPILSIFEAAAMSDLRGSQDTFNLLSATSLDRSEGLGVDRAGADEDLERRTPSFASGTVTVTDSRIQKVSTRVYQGKSAPIVGSVIVNVVDAESWPTTGNLYLGRGTANYEGPLGYTKEDKSSYWQLTLGTGTRRFHNIGETVTLAQNGNRVIAAGTTVQTPQGNLSDAVQFATLYTVTIPDGETTISGVVVVAKKSGIIGNVPTGAINGFPSAPFQGATVTNSQPFSNATDTENYTDFIVRIKNERQSRVKGTDLAITTAVTGITSSDENKRVTSAALSTRQGLTTLYIDDGTGYEEQTQGTALESLADSATGGETSFKLSRRPVAKAFLKSTTASPFALAGGMALSVNVGGVLYTHTFSVDSFRSITNGTGYEVVSSINSDPNLGFCARTDDGGTTVVLLSKTEENEDLEIVASESDSNSVFVFPAGITYSLRLYKNDVLLTKDGLAASIRSNPISSWDVIPSGATLSISVDGTSTATYTFLASHFVAAGTGFSSVGIHTLAAWAKVLNYVIPGITATVNEGAILLTSNVGRTSRARLAISGGTLTALGMFEAEDVSGSDRDYTMNRYTGEIELTTQLAAGDRLSAGSLNTRGFLESRVIAPVTTTGIGHVYVGVDGDATIIETGITTADTFNVTTPDSGSWGARYRIAAISGTPFALVVVGDWLLIWDGGSAWSAVLGMWRVVAATSTYIEFENTGTVTGSAVNFQDVGIAIVRYAGQLQDLAIPVRANYTAATFVDTINGILVGGAASVYRSTRLRLRTNTYGTGDIAVVAVTPEGSKLLIDPASAVPASDGRLGSVESGNPEFGTPDFTSRQVTSSSAVDRFVASGTIGLDRHVVGAKNAAIGLADRYGNNRSFRSRIKSFNTGTSVAILRDSVHQSWQPADRFYVASPYGFGCHDDITVVVDGDTTSKRYTVPLWRSLRPTTNTYAIDSLYKDIGDGTQTPTSLADAFGLSYDFNDHMVLMKARAKTTTDTANRTILWRYKRFGSEGEKARIRYEYPPTASSALTVSVDSFPSGAADQIDVSVVLPSSAKNVPPGIRNTTYFGWGYTKPALLGAVTLAVGFPIASAVRTTTHVTLTLTPPTGLYSISDHGIPVSSNIYVQSSSGSFSSGLKTVTSVSPTTVVYAEAAAAISTPVTSFGTVSLDTAGEALFTGAVPAAIAVGDLVRIGSSTQIPAYLRSQTIKLTHVGPQFLQGYTEYEADAMYETTTISSATWKPILNTSEIQYYPLLSASCTALAISTAVNALDGRCPVTATLLSAGGGSILYSSRDYDGASATAWTSLKDGQNWVATTTAPATVNDDYQLALKRDIDSGIISNSDWANEEIRLVPITLDALAAWLQAPGISGLFSVASVAPSSQAQKLQLATSTTGSSGSIQVQGGAANVATAPIVGAATTSGTTMLATVKAVDATPFTGGQWVSLDNESTLPKSGRFTSLTNLSALTSSGHFTFASPSPVLYTRVGSAHPSVTYQIEKQGAFVAFIGTSDASLAEGDYAYVRAPTTLASGHATISDANVGIFRIVRASSTTFWVENDSAVAQALADANVDFFTASSLMPGDTISINTTLWGADNVGTYVIASLGDPATTPFSDDRRLNVVLADGQTMTAVSSVGAMGATEAAKVVVLEGTPARLIKRISGIVPNQDDASLVDIKFDTADRSASVTAAAGTILTGLDRLAFSTALAGGVDGYNHSVGLIGEATRVVYGDERDRSTYPGVRATGSVIGISGPLVKRFQLELSIRTRLGVSTTDIIDKVKSGVASVINRAPIGSPVAFSDIVKAAGSVNGVLAVTILSPTYAVGSDLIEVQPYEKALVLNVDTDVVVSIVGQ